MNHFFRIDVWFLVKFCFLLALLPPIISIYPSSSISSSSSAITSDFSSSSSNTSASSLLRMISLVKLFYLFFLELDICPFSWSVSASYFLFLVTFRLLYLRFPRMGTFSMSSWMSINDSDSFFTCSISSWVKKRRWWVKEIIKTLHSIYTHWIISEVNIWYVMRNGI